MLGQSIECPYCQPADPVGGWIHRDRDWLVQHGPPTTTAAGGLKVISTRHYVDFCEMTSDEAASFGILIGRLDTALRAVTDVERVHLVSTRDRVDHFHAWLYPRRAENSLRGTQFLAAPQSSEVRDAEQAADAVRQRLRF